MDMIKKEKRGQITIFIILGLILLVTVGLFVSIKSKEATEGVKFSSEQMQKVPDDFVPINLFITECIDKAATDALIKIGESGGYTNITSLGVVISPDATESSVIEFSPLSNVKVAYWWYMSSDNDCSSNCIFSSLMPPLKSEYKSGAERLPGDLSIEAQIDRYVNENLKTCLNGFQDFKDEGFSVEEEGLVTTTTTIGENNVNIVVDYPILIRKGNNKINLNKFYVTIPLNIKKIYEFASFIMSDEANYQFLERNTLNLIAGFSDIDPAKLPPMAGSEFELKQPVYWIKGDVENNIKDMLMAYIPLLQIEDSLNYNDREYSNSIQERIYKQMDIPSYGPMFNSLAANFIYLGWWPIYFDITSKSNIIAPETASTDMLPLGVAIQRYNFNYDISYPVIVMITSPYAFNGRGYRFMFGLEANIRNNQPMNSSFVSLEDNTESNSMLCDLNHRLGTHLHLTARDAVNNEPLPGVMVYYSCGDESCFIGETSLNNGMAELDAQLPICIGGVLTFKKPDFLSYSIKLNSYENDGRNLNIQLEPIVSKNIVIKKKRIVKSDEGWVLKDEPVSFGPKDRAIISLERIGKEGEENYSVMAEYSLAKNQPIRIARGKYKVSIRIVTDESLVIPKQTKTVLFIPVATLPQIVMDKYPGGGLDLSEDNSWSLKSVLGYDTIEFYGLYIDLLSVPQNKRTHEDLEEINKIEEYSRNYRTLLEPRLK